MTRRQRDLYDFIKGYWAEHGHGPSYDDMLDGLHLGSKSGIHRLVYGLVHLGYVRIDPRAKRSIEIVREPHQMTRMSPGDLGLAA